MAKIVRYNGNLQAFASAAPGTERTIFGDVTQANDLTSQINADFLRGWGIVGPSDQPALEDFNGAMYTHGQLLAYLHQVGVPEYNATQEYHIGSITNSGSSLYVSRTNNNTGNTPATSPANWRDLDNASPMVGAKNLRASIASASSSATFTAVEVVVGTALGGKTYRLSSYNLTVNLATVGAGGMDTGSAPVNGYVAIYAIHNPSSGAVHILATNATLTLAPEIYGGANMPAGYTASALLAVLPTNGSGQFPITSVFNRSVYIPLVTVLNIVANRALSPLSISSAVPINAIEIWGELELTSAAVATTNMSISISGTDGTGQQVVGSSVNASGNIVGNYSGVPLVSQQVINAAASTSGASPNFKIYVGGYKI